jgi:hypothetical protein
MHKLQIIYTHEDGQYLANYPLETRVINSKDDLIQFAHYTFLGTYSIFELDKTNLNLPEDTPEIPKLVKLSLCVIIDKLLPEPFIPDWFNEYKGKIWQDDIEHYFRNKSFNP